MMVAIGLALLVGVSLLIGYSFGIRNRDKAAERLQETREEVRQRHGVRLKKISVRR